MHEILQIKCQGLNGEHLLSYIRKRKTKEKVFSRFQEFKTQRENLIRKQIWVLSEAQKAPNDATFSTSDAHPSSDQDESVETVKLVETFLRFYNDQGETNRFKTDSMINTLWKIICGDCYEIWGKVCVTSRWIYENGNIVDCNIERHKSRLWEETLRYREWAMWIP